MNSRSLRIIARSPDRQAAAHAGAPARCDAAVLGSKGVSIGPLRPAHIDPLYRRLRREARAKRIAPQDVPPVLDLLIGAHMPGAPHLVFVAQRTGGRIVGMIAVLHVRANVGMIRHLWVDPRWRSSWDGGALLAHALHESWDRGILKIVLCCTERIRRIRPVFARCGYHFGRRKRINGRWVIEFYRDLYRRLDSPPQRTTNPHQPDLAMNLLGVSLPKSG